MKARVEIDKRGDEIVSVLEYALPAAAVMLTFSCGLEVVGERWGAAIDPFEPGVNSNDQVRGVGKDDGGAVSVDNEPVPTEMYRHLRNAVLCVRLDAVVNHLGRRNRRTRGNNESAPAPVGTAAPSESMFGTSIVPSMPARPATGTRRTYCRRPSSGAVRGGWWRQRAASVLKKCGFSTSHSSRSTTTNSFIGTGKSRSGGSSGRPKPGSSTTVSPALAGSRRHARSKSSKLSGQGLVSTIRRLQKLSFSANRIESSSITWKPISKWTVTIPPCSRAPSKLAPRKQVRSRAPGTHDTNVPFFLYCVAWPARCGSPAMPTTGPVCRAWCRNQLPYLVVRRGSGRYQPWFLRGGNPVLRLSVPPVIDFRARLG